jgi:hypothetical protein
VLEITVDIRRSYVPCWKLLLISGGLYVLCWKLLWMSGSLMSFAGNYCGYQEVLYPVLEITVDMRRSCVLCW